MSVGAQAIDLFNQVSYGTPISSLSNPRFGQSTSLAGVYGGGGGGGGGSNAVRRITLTANFTF